MSAQMSQFQTTPASRRTAGRNEVISSRRPSQGHATEHRANGDAHDGHRRHKQHERHHQRMPHRTGHAGKCPGRLAASMAGTTRADGIDTRLQPRHRAASPRRPRRAKRRRYSTTSPATRAAIQTRVGAGGCARRVYDRHHAGSQRARRARFGQVHSPRVNGSSGSKFTPRGVIAPRLSDSDG